MFNQPLSDWRVDKVEDMWGMFEGASSFNQDISGWAVHSVTDMLWMFHDASAFDQDLGWCVDDDVNFDFQISFDGKYTIQDAFSGTMCASTLCGVKQVAGSGCAP